MNRQTIFCILLVSLLLAACGGGPVNPPSPAAAGEGAAGSSGASANGGTTAAAGQVSLDLSNLQKEYARLMNGSSFASATNVIYYPSLNEYSNCGEDQLHAIQAGQTITPETANPCGGPPPHFLEMTVREDSLDFLHKSQKAETVGGKMVFHYDQGQQVVVKANSEKQQNLLREHAMKIQPPK
jgi:hypothetical protein